MTSGAVAYARRLLTRRWDAKVQIILWPDHDEYNFKHEADYFRALIADSALWLVGAELERWMQENG